jgi:uncharacterized protein YkwD
VPRVYTPVGPAAAQYVDPPLRVDPRALAGLDEFPRAIIDAVGRAAARAQLPAPLPDARLHRVAAEVAQGSSGGKPPPYDVVRFFLSHHGVVETEPALFLLQGAADDGAGALARYEQALPAAFRTTPWNRIGVAVLRRSQHIVVAVVLFEQLLELRPLPRQLPSGGTARVGGRILRAYRNVQLVMTVPSGWVGRLPLERKSDGFEAKLVCEFGDGRYQMEVLGADQHGPLVLANFPVFCGVTPPTDVTVADEPEPQDADPADVEQEVFALINRERAMAGMRPMAWDNRLAAIARAHSREMATTEVVAHVSPTTGDAPARVRRAGLVAQVVAENVGLANGARQAHQGFMGSPGHRANVLNPALLAVGIGVVAGRFEHGHAPLYITELFVNGLQR